MGVLCLNTAQHVDKKV